MSGKVTKSDKEWRQQLTPEQYHVLREKGTERPGSGALLNSKVKGIYRCAGCGQELFRSDTKFESHSGWPSFYEPLAPDSVINETDHSLGMTRTETMCSACGGHLGHVFEDGPDPTGLRYCMNSAAMTLKPADKPADGSEPEEGE